MCSGVWITKEWKGNKWQFIPLVLLFCLLSSLIMLISISIKSKKMDKVMKKPTNHQNASVTNFGDSKLKTHFILAFLAINNSLCYIKIER